MAEGYMSRPRSRSSGGGKSSVRPSTPSPASSRKHGAPTTPQRALLLIEVSSSSLRLDRKVKAPLYAEGGSPEYWIVDVAAARLEVFRAPVAGTWTEHFTLTASDTIRPVSFPEVEFPLGDFLSPLPKH